MDLAKKLQLKPGQLVEAVLVPDSLAATTDLFTGDFVMAPEHAFLVFVHDRSVLEEYRDAIVAAVNDERLTWVSYPKAGQLGTDLNRDTLAALLAESGVQPVRQIALDEVWSALRFRPGP